MPHDWIDLEDDDEDPDEIFEGYENFCAGCDNYTQVDDIGLCGACSAKLDRDMIRQRDWERSLTAWACPRNQREGLRKQVIKKFGAKLELIAPSRPKSKRSKSRKS